MPAALLFFSIFFSKSNFSKNSFRNTIRLSNSLDLDQARQIVGHDLGPNCMQIISADVTRVHVGEVLTFLY